MGEDPEAAPREAARLRRVRAAAEQALAEAAARRLASKADEPNIESGGRDGPDPTRFGDWERRGVAVDF